MSEEIKDEQVEEESDDRNDMLNAIADQAHAEREDQLEDIEDEVVEETEEEETDEEPEEAVEEEAEEEPEEKQEFIEIGGKQVPLEEVLAAGRKAFETPPPVQDEAPEAKAGPTAIELAKERYNAAREKLVQAQIDVDDDAIRAATDEFTEAQSELIRSQMPSPDEIQAQALVSVRQMQLKDRMEAPPEEGGLADILADERATMLARHEVDKRVKHPTDYLNFKVYQEAAKVTREFLGWGKSDGFEEKEAKKKNIVDMKMAHKKVSDSKPKEKELSRKEVISEGMDFLYKSRGAVQ